MTTNDKTNEDKPESKIPEEIRDTSPDNITSESAGTIQAAEPKPETKPEDTTPEDKPVVKDEDKPSDTDEGAAAPDPEATKAEAAQKERDEWHAVPEGVRKRVARSNRQVREAKEKNAELEKRLADLEAGAEVSPKPKVDELSPDDFESFDDYLDEVAKQEKTEATPDTTKTPASKPAQQDFVGTVPAQDFYAARGKLQDAVETADPAIWDQAMEAEELNMSAELVTALSETKDPTGLMRELLNDPEKAKAFSAKTPYAQARDLAIMEAGFAEQEPDTQPSRKTTRAGEPIEGGKTRGGSHQKAHADMDQSEYEKAREEETKSGGGFWL